jgi:HEAT repeat protein
VNRLARLWLLLFALSIGCSPDAAARRQTAHRLLGAEQYDSARTVVSALARRCPMDTGVLALQVRLFSVERRLRAATDALRRHDSITGEHDSALIAQVLNAAVRDGDIACAAVTIGACGELGVGTAYEAVESALCDRDPTIRRAAVYAVPRYRRDDAVDALATVILDDHPAVRADMLKSAAWLGDKRMLDLTRILQFDGNDGVIWSFINMRAALGDNQMRAQVRKELSGEYEILRVDAAATLARLGEKEQLRALVGSLGASDECARAAAARALGDLKATEYTDVLIAAANDKADFVREQVAYALGEMGDERALPALQRLVRDSGPYVRASALVAQVRLRPDEQVIASALADSSLTVRAAAVAALLAIQEARPVPQ